MSEKITSEHQQRLGIVYVRQSSPGQVKNNRESYRVQTGLTRRAEALGWHADRVKILDGDQGTSASQPQSREEFDSLLQMVKNHQVGIVFGVDVARLARNCVDWSWLTYQCAKYGTLLGDHNQVYDPGLPQDSLVLGIQGVLAVHESHVIRTRMEAGLNEKASRGELHVGAWPRGYVVVEGKHLRKHPDRRVQTAIARVFEKFETCTSVNQLVLWLWECRQQLPKAVRQGDATEVEWVDAQYNRVLDMLKNPKYAGMYVYPRHQQKTTVLSCGKVKKTWRLSQPEEWSVVMKECHPAYITPEQYEANQKKITMNAQRYATSTSAPNRGKSLLAGLIECRRCGHKMQASYSSAGCASYSCRNGRRQRDKASSDDACARFRFTAGELEHQLSEQILYAVSPAGVRAAELARQRIASEHDSRRSTLGDRLEQYRYEADLARRRFDSIDPANRLVFDTLSDELEVALQAVANGESALSQFDCDEPQRPTVQELERLAALSDRLEDVWYAPNVDGRLKQQVVRLLIEHVTAELDEQSDEVVLWLKWSSGHHTELRAARRGQGQRSVDLHSTIEALRKIAADVSISRSLNRAGVLTDSGKTWTARRVLAFRKRTGIGAYNEKLKEQSGWLTQREAATYLGISPMSVNRLIQQEILSVEGERRLPQVIQRESLASQEIKAAVQHIKSHGNAPLPKNPNQKSLFFNDLRKGVS